MPPRIVTARPPKRRHSAIPKPAVAARIVTYRKGGPRLPEAKPIAPELKPACGVFFATMIQPPA
jgi:hypothetical protein